MASTGSPRRATIAGPIGSASTMRSTKSAGSSSISSSPRHTRVAGSPRKLKHPTHAAPPDAHVDHEEARMQAARNELDRQAAAAQAASLATAAKPLHVPSTAARSGQILVQLPVVRTDRYADLGPQVTLAENLATVTLVKQQAKAIADLQAIVAEQHKALGELRKQVKLAVTREELGSVITPMVSRGEFEAVLMKSDYRFEEMLADRPTREELKAAINTCSTKGAAKTLDARLQRMENLAQTRSSMLSYAPTAPTTGRRGSVVDTRGSGNADAVQSAHIAAIRQELTGKPDLGVVESMLLSKADADVTKQLDAKIEALEGMLFKLTDTVTHELGGSTEAGELTQRQPWQLSPRSQLTPRTTSGASNIFFPSPRTDGGGVPRTPRSYRDLEVAKGNGVAFQVMRGMQKFRAALVRNKVRRERSSSTASRTGARRASLTPQSPGGQGRTVSLSNNVGSLLGRVDTTAENAMLAAVALSSSDNGPARRRRHSVKAQARTPYDELLDMHAKLVREQAQAPSSGSESSDSDAGSDSSDDAAPTVAAAPAPAPTFSISPTARARKSSPRRRTRRRSVVRKRRGSQASSSSNAKGKGKQRRKSKVRRRSRTRRRSRIAKATPATPAKQREAGRLEAESGSSSPETVVSVPVFDDATLMLPQWARELEASKSKATTAPAAAPMGEASTAMSRRPALRVTTGATGGGNRDARARDAQGVTGTSDAPASRAPSQPHRQPYRQPPTEVKTAYEHPQPHPQPQPQPPQQLFAPVEFGGQTQLAGSTAQPMRARHAVAQRSHVRTATAQTVHAAQIPVPTSSTPQRVEVATVAPPTKPGHVATRAGAPQTATSVRGSLQPPGSASAVARAASGAAASAVQQGPRPTHSTSAFSAAPSPQPARQPSGPSRVPVATPAASAAAVGSSGSTAPTASRVHCETKTQPSGFPPEIAPPPLEDPMDVPPPPGPPPAVLPLDVPLPPPSDPKPAPPTSTPPPPPAAQANLSVDTGPVRTVSFGPPSYPPCEPQPPAEAHPPPEAVAAPPPVVSAAVVSGERQGVRPSSASPRDGHVEVTQSPPLPAVEARHADPPPRVATPPKPQVQSAKQQAPAAPDFQSGAPAASELATPEPTIGTPATVGVVQPATMAPAPNTRTQPQSTVASRPPQFDHAATANAQVELEMDAGVVSGRRWSTQTDLSSHSSADLQTFVAESRQLHAEALTDAARSSKPPSPVQQLLGTLNEDGQAALHAFIEQQQQVNAKALEAAARSAQVHSVHEEQMRRTLKAAAAAETASVRQLYSEIEARSKSRAAQLQGVEATAAEAQHALRALGTDVNEVGAAQATLAKLVVRLTSRVEELEEALRNQRRDAATLQTQHARLQAEVQAQAAAASRASTPATRTVYIREAPKSSRTREGGAQRESFGAAAGRQAAAAAHTKRIESKLANVERGLRRLRIKVDMIPSPRGGKPPPTPTGRASAAAAASVRPFSPGYGDPPSTPNARVLDEEALQLTAAWQATMKRIEALEAAQCEQVAALSVELERSQGVQREVLARHEALWQQVQVDVAAMSPPCPCVQGGCCNPTLQPRKPADGTRGKAASHLAHPGAAAPTSAAPDAVVPSPMRTDVANPESPPPEAAVEAPGDGARGPASDTPPPQPVPLVETAHGEAPAVESVPPLELDKPRDKQQPTKRATKRSARKASPAHRKAKSTVSRPARPVATVPTRPATAAGVVSRTSGAAKGRQLVISTVHGEARAGVSQGSSPSWRSEGGSKTARVATTRTRRFVHGGTSVSEVPAQRSRLNRHVHQGRSSSASPAHMPPARLWRSPRRGYGGTPDGAYAGWQPGDTERRKSGPRSVSAMDVVSSADSTPSPSPVTRRKMFPSTPIRVPVSPWASGRSLSPPSISFGKSLPLDPGSRHSPM